MKEVMDGAVVVYPAPAFDVNLNVGKAKHVLNIHDVNNRTNPATILDTAAFYGLACWKLMSKFIQLEIRFTEVGV